MLISWWRAHKKSALLLAGSDWRWSQHHPVAYSGRSARVSPSYIPSSRYLDSDFYDAFWFNVFLLMAFGTHRPCIAHSLVAMVVFEQLELHGNYRHQRKFYSCALNEQMVCVVSRRRSVHICNQISARKSTDRVVAVGARVRGLRQRQWRCRWLM